MLHFELPYFIRRKVGAVHRLGCSFLKSGESVGAGCVLESPADKGSDLQAVEDSSRALLLKLFPATRAFDQSL